jgi:nucleoside-diphosphate-sugar epimerase
MNAGPPHVIFGTGAVGLATLDALRRRGETARLVNRSGTAPVPDDIEVLGGDASDPAFTTAAARGARVVYQTLNPPYHQWAELFPALQAGVLAAARASGARLVSMENVYMYGRPDGQPLTETRPYAARTKKGTLRARMARELLAAHQAGDVEVVIGRASDYFGPRGGAQSMLGDRVIPAALAGKTATVLGDPDQPHTYTYLPDIGEGLATLGEHPEAPGEVWHLPRPWPAPWPPTAPAQHRKPAGLRRALRRITPLVPRGGSASLIEERAPPWMRRTQRRPPL